MRKVCDFMDEETTVLPNLFKVFFKNLMIEFVLSILLLILLAFLLSTTSLNENIINPSIIFISSFSILIGAFFSSVKIKTKGIVIGSLQGISYMLILYLISSFSNMNFSIGFESIVMITVGIICGALGGIVGVNYKI